MNENDSIFNGRTQDVIDKRALIPEVIELILQPELPIFERSNFEYPIGVTENEWYNSSFNERKVFPILKDICLSFIKKNKDKFSEESLSNFPEELKTEIAKEKNDLDLDCAICLDKLEKDRAKQKYGHDQFHGNCIAKWNTTQLQPTCPICRKKL